MAEITTIARPYAKAAFEFAKAQEGGLKQWSEILTTAAGITRDPSMYQVLSSPMETARKSEIMLAVLEQAYQGEIPQSAQNFIQILAENRRLTALPEVATLYEGMREEEERTIRAELISAFPVSDQQQQQIAAVLKRRLDRDVTLECHVDDSLLGGAIIRAGDLVIDGSARSQLAKLSAVLGQ
ncbi:MAG: F0F1 ATP synthase subunit delta [Candidatus Competibacteraceae bacterium]|nr:F0F1 ATP synthase subunit delta [Candidatus Competibacteraceae bacterium]